MAASLLETLLQRITIFRIRQLADPDYLNRQTPALAGVAGEA
jgi:hypothetical protein